MLKFICWSTALFLVTTCINSAHGQSRLMGDKYTISVANFPDSFGVTYDPVIVPRGQDFFDFDSIENDGDEWNGGVPVELTFDGIEEQAGGLLVNERTTTWAGKDGGIFAVQASGIDGETEFDLLDWEVEGEVIEFSFKSANGGALANEANDNSFYSV